MTERRRGDGRARASSAIALVAAVAVVLGCAPRRTAFQQQAGEASSTLLAAATTLRFRHEGKLIRTYVVGSFENYRDLLSGVPDALREADGAPPDVDALAAMLEAAEPALERPCFEPRCDWRGQVEALESAGKALLAASEG